MRTIASTTIKLAEWSIFLVLIILLFLVASSLLPSKSFLSTYVVSTGSMEPEIATGSLVWVRGADEYKVNDVVVFPSPNSKDKAIVHRIDEVELSGGSTTFITKGDNNESQDNWVLFEKNIVGKVFLTIPLLGGLIGSLKTPVGFGMLLVIPVVLFLIFQFRKIKEGIDDEVSKRTAIELKKALEAQSSSETFSTEDEKDLANNKTKSKTPEKTEKKNIDLDAEREDLLKSILTKQNSLLLLLLMSAAMVVSVTLPAYALFSATANVAGLEISTADEFPIKWDGGLEIINKTTGSNLNIDPFHGETEILENIAFRPIELSEDAHHFTTIIKSMKTNQMIQIRTMLTRWTIENFRHDGHLGFTFWQEGEYWLQVNAYKDDGSVEGYYYAILNVFKPIINISKFNIPSPIDHAEKEPENDTDQVIEEEVIEEESVTPDEKEEVEIEKELVEPLDQDVDTVEEVIEENSTSE